MRDIAIIDPTLRYWATGSLGGERDILILCTPPSKFEKRGFDLQIELIWEMPLQWWAWASILVSTLILISTISNKLKYKQLQRAYEYYEGGRVEGEFLEYVFLDPTEIEAESMDWEILRLKKEERKWGAIATASYAMAIIISGSIILLLFYEVASAPQWVGYLFLFFILLSAYSMHRSWRVGFK